MHVNFSAYYTLILAVLVLLLGKLLVSRIRFLRDFNIPEPVAGGLVGSAVFGSTLGTVGGAAAGALIGNEVGRNNDRGYRHRH